MLAHQVDLSIMIYALFLVGVLILLHNCGGISFDKLFSSIIREFRSLLRNGLDRSKINAITLIFMFIIIVLYLFVEPVQKLIELTHEVRGGSEGGLAPGYVFLACLFVLAVFGYLSVVATDRR